MRMINAETVYFLTDVKYKLTNYCQLCFLLLKLLLSNFQ